MRAVKTAYALAVPLLLNSLMSFAHAEELICAVDLIRHGARTASGDLPTAPHTWQEGKGQLTALGMQQEYQLGRQLQQRYMVAHHLLPPFYQANSMYIRSTDYDRTIMSAQSLLMGLYAPGSGPILADGNEALPYKIQPIPIHTIPTAQDEALLIDLFAPEIEPLIARYVYTDSTWQHKLLELSAHYAHWSQLTGLTVENFIDVLQLADIVQAYVAHDIPLPEGLSITEANRIIAAGSWLQAALFKPEIIGDTVGKAALHKIVAYLKRATKANSPIKFVLISAHDVTTLAVMSALHVPLGATPTYASDLNFALYKSSTGNYLVKISYNNQPLVIPACAGTECRLEQLIDITK